MHGLSTVIIGAGYRHTPPDVVHGTKRISIVAPTHAAPPWHGVPAVRVRVWLVPHDGVAHGAIAGDHSE